MTTATSEAPKVAGISGTRYLKERDGGSATRGRIGRYHRSGPGTEHEDARD